MWQSTTNDLKKTDVDYLRLLTSKARDKKPHRANQPIEKRSEKRTFEQRIKEAMTIAAIFAHMNETKWNLLDDDFYIVSRKWFESWKVYLSYDYIMIRLVQERRKVSDLSVNQIMLNGKVSPGEVQNWTLVLDTQRYYNRSSKAGDAIHTPLRDNVQDGREFIVVPKSAW